MKRWCTRKNRGRILGLLFLSSISIISRDFMLSLPGLIDRFLLISPCSDLTMSESIMNTMKSQRTRFSRTCVCKLFQFMLESHGLSNTWKSMKSRYKRLRCHLRMGKVYLPKRWIWHQVYISQFSIHSSDTCTFVDISSHSIDSEMTRSTTTLGILQKNILQTRVLSNSNTPPPIIEIDQLSINWHSWTKPIIDVNCSDINIHVILGSTFDDSTSSTRTQGLHGAPLNFPFILLGNSSIPEILQAIPQPPLKEGLYPRMGIVNISQVSINVYGYPAKVLTDYDVGTTKKMDSIWKEDSNNSKTLTYLWSVSVPDDVFIPLLYATQDAGPMGIDQMLISSVIIKSIGLGYWNHFVQEQKRVNLFMYNTIEAVETWFTMIREKIHQGGQILDTHVDRITSAFEQGIEQILSDEMNPLRNILIDWRQKLDEFLNNFEFQGRKILEDNLVMNNDWSELWHGLGRNISQGWDEFHKKYLSAKT